MKKQLRAHQVRAVKDLISVLENKDRATFVSAIGTGKTITLQAVAERISKNTLVCLPSISLVDQVARSWFEQYTYMDAYAICSDSTVGREYDDIFISGEMLSRIGLKVLSDTSEITDVLRERSEKTNDTPFVIFSTYQSSYKVAEAQKLVHGFSFDLLVADEAHYLAAEHRSIRSGFSVLDNKLIKSDKRIFATATRKIVSTHESEGSTERFFVGTMDDKETFGPIAHEFGLRDAIEEGVLCDYKIMIVEIEGDWPEDAHKDPQIRLSMGISAYKKMKETYGIKRTIAYLSNKRRARVFSELVEDATFIVGEMKQVYREEKLKKLRDNGGVIANVRCLTEGIDIPSLDAVEFIDPRKSKVDIVQAVGRAIRKDEDNPDKIGYVIIPVLKEPDDEYYGEKGSFKIVWDVLSQMAENDSAVETQLREAAEKKEPSRKNIIEVLGITEFQEVSMVSEELTKKISIRAAYVNDPFLAFMERTDLYAEISQYDGDEEQFLHEQHQLYLLGGMSSFRARLLDTRVPHWRTL